MGQKIDQAIIKKYLLGQCTDSEARQVEAYLRLPESADTLDRVLTETLPDDIRLSSGLYPDEVQAAIWRAKVHERIGASKIIPFPKPPGFRWRHPIAAAAIILLIAGLSLWMIYPYKIDKTSRTETGQLAFREASNPLGRRTKITLSDSSIVYLGAGSRLRYASPFSKKRRDLFLEGEAFFEVKEDATRPFVVHTRDLQTKVLGTSFKVEAFEHWPVSVAVATGKVRVDQFKAGKLITEMGILTPGQKVVYSLEANTSKRLQVPERDISGWTTSRLAFNGESLKYIASQLERWYGVSIDFASPAISGKEVTITLMANVPLTRIMQVLTEGTGFHYRLQGKKITIY